MDLWIKAQNGRLSKVEDIMQPIEDEFDSVSGWVLYARSKDSMFLLGIYESKERAMEVLQEICKYKDKLDKANFLGMTESEFVSSIFEMPEK